MAALIPVTTAVSAIAKAATGVSHQRKKSKSKPASKDKSRKRKTKNSKSVRRLHSLSTAVVPFGAPPAHRGDLTMFRQLCDDALGKLTGNGLGVYSSVSSVKNKIDFSHAHLAQRDIEKSFRNGVRVLITNTDGGTVNPLTGVTNGKGFLAIAAAGSAQGNFSGAFSQSATTVAFSRPIIPSLIDDKLSLLSQVFEFSAPRYMKVRYMPSVGDFTTTAVDTNVQLALGICTDPEDGISGTTFKQVCDLENHNANHVSRPFEIEFVHTGQELYKTDLTAADDAQEMQAGLLLARFDKDLVSGSTAVVPYGHTQIFAIWDFYGLRTIDNHADLKYFPAAKKDSAVPRLLMGSSDVKEDYIDVEPTTSVAASALAPVSGRRKESVPQKR